MPLTVKLPRYCTRETCQKFYLTNTSGASLPLQFCSIACEQGHLGFSLIALEKNDYIFKKEEIPSLES